ncbi:hypothetical protein, partial [Phocaeicola sp.]|uniref:hypothetical protein n=1 Tax=Phocaeicola sp. TaxID=2773926 RepID=UPI003AB21791
MEITPKACGDKTGPVKFNDKLSKSRSESGKKVVAKLLKDSALNVSLGYIAEMPLNFSLLDV